MQYIEKLRLQECQNKLMELCEEEVRDYRSGRGKLSSLFMDCIQEYPIEMSFLICESICPIPLITNVLKESRHRPFRFDRWKELAEIFTNKINPVNEELINVKEYISLTQLIKSEIDIKKDLILQAKLKCESRHPSTVSYWHLIEYFFELLGDEIYEIFFYFCWIVYRGLPLYKEIADNKFSIVQEYDSDFTYLFMNGFYGTCPTKKKFNSMKYASNLLMIDNGFYFPSWTTKFYINTKQLSIFNELHIKKEYAREDEQTIHLRRTAYRKAIGIKDDFHNFSDQFKLGKNVIFSNSHETKLMRIQRKVIERYYGNHFDLNDPDTWTKQTIIVDWLKQEYALSEREAKAIDMITRPDIARGK